MKVLIVDDEPVARRVLREELELLPDVEIVGEADDGDTALEQIRELHPDLVFLDLQMPTKGGFEVIRELQGGPLPRIVIVTAYDEHAIRAFDAGAIDYLLKPVSHDRLLQTIDRARQFSSKPGETAGQVSQLQEIAERAVKTATGPKRIVGRLGEEYFLLNTSEVLAFQAEGELVWIITHKQRLLATHTLRELQMRLAGLNFQRVHRNALVNVTHVRKLSSLSSQRWLLTLNNNMELVVSKRQAKVVRELLS